MNTNDAPIIQQIAAAHGYHLSGYEVAALAALPSAVVTHFWAVVKFWQHVGGWQGIKNFIKTGNNKPTT